MTLIQTIVSNGAVDVEGQMLLSGEVGVGYGVVEREKGDELNV
jgi:hypothetical protein